MPGKGLAQMIAVVETEGLADAKFQQVWIWNDSHGVVPDTAGKDNSRMRGRSQGRARAPYHHPGQIF